MWNDLDELENYFCACSCRLLWFWISDGLETFSLILLTTYLPNTRRWLYSATRTWPAWLETNCPVWAEKHAGACVCSSYLWVVTVVVEIVGVGSVGAPVIRLLEHFLGFGRHPRLALSHATLWRSGTHTYTQVRGLQIRKVFNWRNWLVVVRYSLTNQEADLI